VEANLTGASKAETTIKKSFVQKHVTFHQHLGGPSTEWIFKAGAGEHHLEGPFEIPATLRASGERFVGEGQLQAAVDKNQILVTSKKTGEPCGSLIQIASVVLLLRSSPTVIEPVRLVYDALAKS
jgi:hypothetical protein